MSNIVKFGCGTFLPGFGPGNLNDFEEPTIDEPGGGDGGDGGNGGGDGGGGEEEYYICIPAELDYVVPGGTIPDPEGNPQSGPLGGYLIGETPTSQGGEQGTLYTYQVGLQVISNCIAVTDTSQEYLYSITDNSFKTFFDSNLQLIVPDVPGYDFQTLPIGGSFFF